MRGPFTVLLLLVAFMITAFVLDAFKLADYPYWVRAIGVIWLVVSLLLGIAVMFIKPKPKYTPPALSATTMGNNSPIYQTAGNLVINPPPSRYLDTAELANTTNYQELFIIDMFNDIHPPRKGEVDALLSKLGEENPFLLAKIPIGTDLADLMQRGILAQNDKLAQKRAEVDGVPSNSRIVGNVFLTQKGKRLAEDLLYVREHPESNVSRPIETWRKN